MAPTAVSAANVSNISNSNAAASATKSAAPKSNGEPSDVLGSVILKDSAYGGVKCQTEKDKLAIAQPTKSKSIARLEKKIKPARLCGLLGTASAILLSSVFFALGILSMMGTIYFFEVPNVRKMAKN